MPELPEVETICREIIPYARQQKIIAVTIRQHQLRWPIFPRLPQVLQNQTIHDISRRAKYILIKCEHGTLIIHLGMSGKLRIVTHDTPIAKHDHVDVVLSNDCIIRYTDPRRFGSIHWTTAKPQYHKLLCDLGVEPLTDEFSGRYLFVRAREKSVVVKKFLMNAAIVVGIGNIYASEALFLAQLAPLRKVNTISLAEYTNLVRQIKRILRKAINAGGTTLNYSGQINTQDFFRIDGSPGYFFQKLMVYGRSGKPCYNCGMLLKSSKINQRTTVFCPNCQH